MAGRAEALHTESLLAQLGLVGSAPVGETAARDGHGLTVRHLPALFAASDITCVVLAAALSGLASGLGSAVVGLAGVLVAVAVVLAAGPYRRSEKVISHTTLDELPTLVQIPTLAALALGGTADLLSSAAPSMGTLWTFWLTAFALLVCLRPAIRHAVCASGTAERALVIGPAAARERLRRHLATAPCGIVTLVGELELADVGRGDDARLTLEELVARHRAERVFVMPADNPDRAAAVVRRARNLGVTATLCPRVIEAVGADAHVEQVGGTLMLTATSSSPSPQARAAKRALDVMGAALGLLVLSPLLAAIALAIRLDSPGPVLFRQVRVGRAGRRFEIVKFRTMGTDAESRKEGLREHNETHGLFKIAADPRVTRVGRALRRAALDELPQLLNVLRGEMSLVGPRPLVCDEDELVEGWHRDRLRVRPGMTGPWQVLGSARIPLNDMVALDHQYTANWSVWSDVRILLRTALFVCTRRGL